jgi:hypothetical protein
MKLRHCALALCTAWALMPAAAPAGEVPTSCELADADRRWIQKSLDGWEKVSREFLQLDPEPLPWMILFDQTCAWHLAPEPAMLPDARHVETGLSFAGEPVPAYVVAHQGKIRLPDGGELSPGPIATTSLYRDGEATYFVVGLPEVWRDEPWAKQGESVDDVLFGVLSHEIVHTRHLVLIGRKLSVLVERHSLPAVMDDDVIEKRFGKKRRFREVFEAERDLFFEAAAEPDAERSRLLTAQGLELARQRRARHFKGRNAPYAELEETFLAMEGVAAWAQYKVARSDPGEKRSDAELLAFVRGENNSWSQDEGLALFLLIEKMAPVWQRRVLGAELATPLFLLEDALGMPHCHGVDGHGRVGSN